MGKIRFLFFSCTIVFFLMFSCDVEKKSTQNVLKERPNVLFITVDDLNDWIGCLAGHPDTKTPNIDQLANEGTLFKNAHCAAPLCGPSRIAVMTGKYPSSTGFYMNGQSNFRKRLKGIKTLPEYFRKNGYYTLGTGKTYPDSKVGKKLSFYEYYEIDTSKVANINNYIYNNGPKGRFKNWVLDGGPLDVTDSQMVDGYTSDWVVDKLKNTSFDKPFFMSLGIFRPHIDWFAPRKYFEKFDPEKIQLANVNESDLEDIPEYGKKLAIGTDDAKTIKRDLQARQATAAYLANVNFADAMIGKVLDALKKSKYADNTIVVLWSDHGWHLGEKEHWRKFTLWQEATRVPLIIKLPKGNTITETRVPVSLIDLYPTLIDLCNLPKYKENQGVSLRKILEGNEESKEPILVSYGKDNNSVVSDRYTYIQYRDNSVELYDNLKDSNQWENLATRDEFKKTIERLKYYIPNESAENQPNYKGSLEIELWHERFAYIGGQKIEFQDW